MLVSGETPIQNLSVTEIKDELKQRRLDSEGSLVVLVRRLYQARREAKSIEPPSSLPPLSPQISKDSKMTASEQSGGETKEIVERKDEAGNVLDESLDLEIIDDNENGHANNPNDPEGEDEYEEEDVPEEIKESELKTDENEIKVADIEPEKEPEQAKIEEIESETPKIETESRKSMEKSEQEEEQIAVVIRSASPSATVPPSQEDEIFLDYEEDLLDDPLDEEPLKDEEKKAVDDEPKETTSPNPSGGGASGLLADDAKKTSIWIRGMAPSTKASSVKQLTSQYGKVIQSKIFNSRPINGEIKNCFALVTFAETAAMEQAIGALQKKNYQGRVLRVETVSDSPLTNSAERIAKEKRAAEEKQKPPAPPLQQAKEQEKTPKKKRAIITPPESTPPRKPKTGKEQKIQPAPKRPQIQAPPRSRSRENQEQPKRKPITYKDSPDRSSSPRREASSRTVEKDSRRIIAAAPSRVKKSPIRTSSRSSGAHQESLIISARVDTSGCINGGAAIKRSVERTVLTNNISTSQLRRHQNYQAPPPPPSATRRGASPLPRASYQTEQYSREHHQPRRRQVSPEIHETYRQDSRGREPAGRGRRGGYEEPDRRRAFDEQQHQTEQERLMLEMLEKTKEEARKQKEKLQMEAERERLRFEAEKLERAKLEIELQKQKLALERAAFSVQMGGGRGDERRGRDSRRRPAASEVISSTPAKMHTNERGSRGSTQRRGEDAKGGRHSNNNNTSSSRHPTTTTTSYGIQSSLHSQSTRVTPPDRHADYISKDYSKLYEQPQQQATTRSNNNFTRGFEAQASVGGGGASFQGYGYTETAYQQPVWGGLDGQGQMSMDTNWTNGATSSSSTSSSGANNTWHNNGTQYSQSNNRRDYGYRNNY